MLILVALALIVASALLFTKGASAAPGDSQAETLSSEYADVTKAATDGTTAFLTVDYKNMDPLIANVLKRSTGTFKEQYSRAKVNLKATAQDGLAVSNGTVLEGRGSATSTTATPWCSWRPTPRSATSPPRARPPQARSYRLKLTMAHKGDKWLTSDLQFVA